MRVWTYWLSAIAVMAIVTYIPRVLPLSLVRHRTENRFLKSFLYYMPFAVLGAMTFPSLLYATAAPVSALFGMAAALLMAFFGASLLPVALVSTIVVFLTEQIMNLLGFL
ncbi:hypothetical protein SDC9_198693 [bioreactor metagenome]|uniref:Branched-chain amino acid transport protein AzlD n=1 Tax=bioreactor metagenome TaxID=1076179 RepID=A0A645IJL4_9ZZZZ